MTAISATVSPLALAERGWGRGARPPFPLKRGGPGAPRGPPPPQGPPPPPPYQWGRPVLRWGPPVPPGAEGGQEAAPPFGYNNDFLGYFPIDGSNRGLLAVNHEYTNEELMFPGLGSRRVRHVQEEATSASPR